MQNKLKLQLCLKVKALEFITEDVLAQKARMPATKKLFQKMLIAT